MVFRKRQPTKDVLESGREYCPFCGRDWLQWNIFTGVCGCGSTRETRYNKTEVSD